MTYINVIEIDNDRNMVRTEFLAKEIIVGERRNVFKLW